MNEEILSQLKDIHWPKPPSIWPLALGYYVVIFLGLVILAFLGYFFFVVRKRLKFRRIILSELSLIELAYIKSPDAARVQASICALLRRILFYKSKNLSPSFDLLEAQETLLNLFPDREKLGNLITLLNKDRFHKSPDVDGLLLIKLVREQFKKCRI
jgi:hypothetical protein